MRLSSAGQDEDNVEEEQPLASVDIDSAELENTTEDLMKNEVVSSSSSGNFEIKVDKSGAGFNQVSGRREFALLPCFFHSFTPSLLYVFFDFAVRSGTLGNAVC